MIICPSCGQDAKFLDYRDCRVTTLLGTTIYERAYYYCGHCHAGVFPTDAEFGLDRHQSAGAREVITLMGVLEPFDEGAHSVLPRLSGINVSASTVQRTTEAEGQRLAQRRIEGATYGPPTPWRWHRDASGRTVAYAGLDASGVRQQGPHGEKAEGRMPWVAAVFNPQPADSPQSKRRRRRRQRVWESRYVSGVMSLPQIGAQLRRECQDVGVAGADLVIALTDGGHGLEECLTDVLGGVARQMLFILDFWHVTQHLQEFANLAFADDAQRQTQMTTWCQRLKHAGGAAVLNELESLTLSRATPATRESHRQVLGYFRNNLHRMDYPTYVTNGWHIGSGKIESACKSVIGGRLKGPGMRWHESGTTALCQLRALYKSQPACWQHYWNQTAAA
jgi:hypothetical protein